MEEKWGKRVPHRHHMYILCRPRELVYPLRREGSRANPRKSQVCVHSQQIRSDIHHIDVDPAAPVLSPEPLHLRQHHAAHASALEGRTHGEGAEVDGANTATSFATTTTTAIATVTVTVTAIVSALVW